MVKRYSITEKGKEFRISPNFTLGEFQSGDGADSVLVSDELLDVLEKIRAWARDTIPGCVVEITSGYRTHDHNRRVGGAAGSKHCEGIAADFKVRMPNGKCVKPMTIHEALEHGEITGKRFKGGLGLYKSWNHIDVRTHPEFARWNG